MGRKKLPAYENITVEEIAAEGKSIARIDDIVVFLTGAVPGDVVNIQITRKRKRYWEGRIIDYIRYSAVRTDPFCLHFGICGGCKWQHLPYDEQLRYKEKQVLDSLQRIGKIEIEQIEPIIGALKTTFYRNKLEFTFSNHRWLTKEETSLDEEITNRNGLGFHVPGRFDRVVDIEKCYLQEDPSNAIRNILRGFALKHDLEFYDHTTNDGLLRNLIIRTSSAGDLMVILSSKYEKPIIYEMLDDLYNKQPGISSLMVVFNEKKNESLYDQDIILYKGSDHIIEELDGLKFKIGPKSFFQTNTQQALELYRTAKNYASLTGSEVVYDLYTGTGTIANYVASSCKKVIGIESVAEAIGDARINSDLNNISNTAFFAGDMKEIFTEVFIQNNGRPDVIIADPPRAGIHPDVIARMLIAAPEKIVYISCNPATQARDIQLLSEGYRVVRTRAVDMFPHTHHIENVALLVKKTQDPRGTLTSG